MSSAARAGAMLGASSAIEIAATTKRDTERLLIYFSPHRVVGFAIDEPSWATI
jgi:hypothetical protein